MADLKKLFVSVSGDAKVTEFLNKVGKGEDGTGNAAYSSTYKATYDSKIVFLGATGQIYTQGNLYGAKGSDVEELKNILEGFDSDGSDVNLQSVKAAIEAATNAALGTTTYTLGSTPTNTVDSVSTRVKTIEDLIADNTGSYITATAYNALSDKEKAKYSLVTAEGDHNGEYYSSTVDIVDRLSEVIDWFAGVQTTETGAALIADVAANKAAIGTKKDGATAATGLYKEIEDVKTANTQAITGLKVTDTAVDGKYVSAVSQTDGKITVTRADLPTLSVKTGSEDYVAVNNHEVEIKTTALGDAVGITKATEGTNAGKWVAADGSVVANPGLATVADVTAEIVADEQVIAAALNDHESRIAAFEGTGENSVAGQISTAISKLKTSSNINVATLSGNKVTLTNAIQEENGIISSTGTAIQLEDVAYTGAAANVTVAAINKTKVTVAANATVDSALSTIATAIDNLDVDHSITTIGTTTGSTYVTIADDTNTTDNDHAYTITVTEADYSTSTDKFTTEGIVTSTVLSNVLGDLWETI